MVAIDWDPVIQFLSGAGVAVGGGAAAAWLQGKSQERIERRRLRREEDMERQQRRERAAEVLADVSGMLQDIQAEEAMAERLGSVVRNRPDKLEALAARCQAASAQLILMTIREPSPEVRRLARELERAMSNSVAVLVVIRAGRAVEADSEESTKLAHHGVESLATAQRLLGELVDTL